MANHSAAKCADECAECDSRFPVINQTITIQPAALATSSTFPGPRSAAVSTARGQMFLITELENTHATD